MILYQLETAMSSDYFATYTKHAESNYSLTLAENHPLYTSEDRPKLEAMTFYSLEDAKNAAGYFYSWRHLPYYRYQVNIGFIDCVTYTIECLTQEMAENLLRKITHPIDDSTPFVMLPYRGFFSQAVHIGHIRIVTIEPILKIYDLPEVE